MVKSYIPVSCKGFLSWSLTTAAGMTKPSATPSWLPNTPTEVAVLTYCLSDNVLYVLYVSNSIKCAKVSHSYSKDETILEYLCDSSYMDVNTTCMYSGKIKDNFNLI